MHWCKIRVRFNEVPEKVPKLPEKVREALLQSQVRFNKVPEKVPEPGQVQQGSGEGSGEGLGGFGADPGQVQQGSGEGSGARSGSTGFRRRFRRRFRRVFRRRFQETLLQSQVRFNRVPEKVPEKVPGSLGAKPSQVRRAPEKVPALGFAARFRKICQNKIKKRCGCWGYHRSLVFLIP